MALASRLFSIGPRFSKDRGVLRAVTGWRVWLLTLGLANREVIVNPDRQVILIRDRRFWFFPSKKTIKFSHIRAIAYGYSDQNDFGALNLARDTFDVFRVGLKLHGDYDNYQHLFRFMGEGSFVNDGPLPDWFYWEDYLFDLEGTQTAESKLFVELLMKMTKARLEPI
jgi:hypothetical protein